jgi:hypothetical protein
MRRFKKLLWTCAAIAAATPAGAQAPMPPAASPGAFDGAYVGVSAQFLGYMGTGSGRGCPHFAAPGRLTIANGHAQAP